MIDCAFTQPVLSFRLKDRQRKNMPLFKRDPAKKLRKSYQLKLESAMHAMRRGDVRENARLIAEAELIQKEIADLEAANG